MTTGANFCMWPLKLKISKEAHHDLPPTGCLLWPAKVLLTTRCSGESPTSWGQMWWQISIQDTSISWLGSIDLVNGAMVRHGLKNKMKVVVTQAYNDLHWDKPVDFHVRTQQSTQISNFFLFYKGKSWNCLRCCTECKTWSTSDGQPSCARTRGLKRPSKIKPTTYSSPGRTDDCILSAGRWLHKWPLPHLSSTVNVCLVCLDDTQGYNTVY